MGPTVIPGMLYCGDPPERAVDGSLQGEEEGKRRRGRGVDEVKGKSRGGGEGKEEGKVRRQGSQHQESEMTR